MAAGLVEPTEADVEAFGFEHGRDMVLVVEGHRFHIHSSIVRGFLTGTVFSTLVEQAYAAAEGEVVLFGDEPRAWRLLLTWVYGRVGSLIRGAPQDQFTPEDALLMLPVAHKYEADLVIPLLHEVLSAPDSEFSRTSHIAKELMRHEAYPVVKSWFEQVNWATGERVLMFLGDVDFEIDDRLTSLVVERACKILLKGKSKSKMNIALKLAASLPDLSQEDHYESVKTLRQCKFLRSPVLAKVLEKVGQLDVAFDWFGDEDWEITAEVVVSFAKESCAELAELFLVILHRLSEKTSAAWHDAAALESVILAHLRLPACPDRKSVV